MSDNTHKIEFFFDYACPYCRQAYQTLTELLRDYPKMEIIWCPCESHPRPVPAVHGMHSDLCIQGMFFAADNDIDLWQYHKLAFSLMHGSDINVENIDTLAQSLATLADAKKLKQALHGGIYLQALQDANRYAFEQSGVWALPALRANGNKLDAVIDVGITEKQIRNFISNNHKAF